MNLLKIFLTGLILTLIALGLSWQEAAQAAPLPKPQAQGSVTVMFDNLDMLSIDGQNLLAHWDADSEIQGMGDYRLRRGFDGEDRYGQIDISIPPVPELAIYSVVGLGLYNQQNYDPSQEGAITLINFDLTARFTQTNSPSPVANVYLIAVQNNRVFYATSGATMTEVNNRWQPFRVQNLQASDFAAWDRLAGNPDFSENGSPITFGFLTGTDRSQTLPAMPIDDTLRMRVEINYWRVEIFRETNATGSDLQITSCCSGVQSLNASTGSSLLARYQYVITNLGPAPATNVTITIPQDDNSYRELFGLDGSCENLACTFERLEPGESVEAVGWIEGSRRTENNAYLGTFGLRASVTADESDPNQDNNHAFEDTSFYDCEQAGCFLDQMFCKIRFSPSSAETSSALISIEKLTQTAQSAFIPDLPFYYDLRELMLTREGGVQYNTLYNTHNMELFELTVLNPNLWDSALTTLELWEPNLKALTAGEGGTAVITAEQITALDTFLSDIAAVASPELAQVIADERANLPAPDEFVGMTIAEAAETALGAAQTIPAATSVYLPLIVK